MTGNFTIEEFLIEPEMANNVPIVPVDVATKLVKYHINIIQPIRTRLGFSITASQKSGYRPVWYERNHGRSGTSEHTFSGKGAVDYTCWGKRNILKLFEELKKSDYKRVCYYPGKHFIHCDHKGYSKRIFMCHNGRDWTSVPSNLA